MEPDDEARWPHGLPSADAEPPPCGVFHAHEATARHVRKNKGLCRTQPITKFPAGEHAVGVECVGMERDLIADSRFCGWTLYRPHDLARMCSKDTSAPKGCELMGTEAAPKARVLWRRRPPPPSQIAGLHQRSQSAL